MKVIDKATALELLPITNEAREPHWMLDNADGKYKYYKANGDDVLMYSDEYLLAHTMAELIVSIYQTTHPYYEYT